MLENPEQANIRQQIRLLANVTNALWKPARGKKLHPEVAAAIAEWTISQLEKLIQDIRRDLSRFKK
jgi:hypothetical protein